MVHRPLSRWRLQRASPREKQAAEAHALPEERYGFHCDVLSSPEQRYPSATCVPNEINVALIQGKNEDKCAIRTIHWNSINLSKWPTGGDERGINAMINRRATTPRGGGIHRATVNNFGERQYKIYRKNITSDRQPMHASLRLLKLTALNKSNDDDNEHDWVKVRNDTDKVTRSMHEDIGFVEER